MYHRNSDRSKAPPPAPLLAGELVAGACAFDQSPQAFADWASLRLFPNTPSVDNDIIREFFDMIRVAVAEISGCMATGAAISPDVMATANQIRSAAKRALPFSIGGLNPANNCKSYDAQRFDEPVVEDGHSV